LVKAQDCYSEGCWLDFPEIETTKYSVCIIDHFHCKAAPQSIKRFRNKSELTITIPEFFQGDFTSAFGKKTNSTMKFGVETIFAQKIVCTLQIIAKKRRRRVIR